MILQSILGKDCLLTYDMPKEHRIQLQELLDDLEDIDIECVKPALIDWDNARILKKEEDDDTGDLIYHLVPLDSMVSKFWKDIDSI